MAFAVEIGKFVTPILKKWAGIYRGADRGLLYRSRDLFGLGITNVVHHFRKMQIVKCSILSLSKDEQVRTIYFLKSTKKFHTSRASRSRFQMMSTV